MPGFRTRANRLSPLPESLGTLCKRIPSNLSAWVSAYCPGIGWLDMDPTNNIVPSNGHVTLAWGRDYGDVSPLRGLILGGGAHTLKVGVDMEPLDP